MGNPSSRTALPSALLTLPLTAGFAAHLINQVHEKTQQCLKDPALLKRYDAAKQVVVPGAVEDVRKFAERDTALWKPLVQRLGIRND